ncbi:beta-L-arabinofuranosidase domain-containing protein [Caldilinea sp.]|uniref:glycoside hydrolase family 127 protein n=1 Tax=Caldilinea sp. TaxID=2293560 RepID=UPI002BDDC7DC|nr:glycoside hydrolase family 127 protein [Caldilinea sp.]HRA68763.1 glycoside hydrolase family 127 protein [Caldilinea sp.]
MPTQSAKRQLTPVPFTQVTLDDPFWAPRQETNRAVSIPHMHQMLVDTGRIAAFDLNFERKVPSRIVEIFGDSDPAKWLEAASYSLITHPDPELAALVDAVADKIIAAQQPDGYLNTHFTVTQPEMRWKNLRDWHEMYCAGHLMEAAVAHFEATGNPKLLNALARYADHIDERFGPNPGQRRGYGGHPEIELALVRLYHATGEERYLALSKYLVEERGQPDPHYYDLEAVERGEDPKNFWAKNYEYCQAHAPLREHDKVVGHAVRVMYLMAGVADLAHEYDDPTLLAVCERLWANLVHQRMYLTGGIGPSRHNEGFTTDYDLPDESAYAETCASIALIMWNHRLLQFAGDGKYADIVEQTLYNGFISGVSLAGDSFFYVNPLASDGAHHRTPWFECPCCPPNVGRILASLGNYLYSTSDGGLWVHFYAQNSAHVTVDGQPVQVRLTSNYPWEGAVKLALTLDAPQHFALNLRIPGWCDEWAVTVNGAAVESTPASNGYVAITRTWQPDDVVDLDLAMPVQAVYANPNVRHMQGRLALQRGPIVFCMEGVDNDNIGLDRVTLDPAQVAGFRVEQQPEMLGGVVVLRGSAQAITEEGWDNQTLYRRNQPSSVAALDVVAVPYATWDNRTPGEMRVWFRAG